MATSPAKTSPVDLPAPLVPVAEPARSTAAVRAERQPAPAAKRARGRAAAAKPAEAAPAAQGVAVESVESVGRVAPEGKRVARKSGAAAKVVAPVLRKPVRKVMAAASGDGSAGAGEAKALASAKVTKPEASRKRDKLVRDSFTMPKGEYALLADLKQRAATLARPAKKSELLRAGVKALAGMGDTAFLAALYDVPALKTGRPSAQDALSNKTKAGKAGERRGS